ncbi:MAG TPA: hypothetical protein DF613_01895 [Lachnospiraceae bacterium]|nr:hypothetical protein [Lachnospiraceae bacterium]
MKFRYIQEKGLILEPLDSSGVEEVLVEFEPLVIRRVVECNMRTGEKQERYYVAIKDIHGNIGEEHGINSFHNIRYYVDFGQPDGLITAHKRALLEYKLQSEATCMEAKVVPLYPPGLYKTIDGDYVYLLGDCLIKSGEREVKRIGSQSSFEIKEKGCDLPPRRLWAEEARRFISFLPGGTEMIFYASLLGIVKPFVGIQNEFPDFITAIIGKSGSMKTSLVRKYALWNSNLELQEINFQSSDHISDILARINSLSGMNFLVDDLHTVYATQTKNQQRDRLDKLARYICGHPQCANVFVTGEHLKDMGIFSVYDRMIWISMPQMSPQELHRLKRKMRELPDSFMAHLALEFAMELVGNYEKVLQDIQEFFRAYVPLGFEDPTTRLMRHVQFLRLVEYLYRLYVCKGDCNLACQHEFEKALERNVRYQQKFLLQQRKAEEETDYIKAVYECLTNQDKYIHVDTNSMGYMPNDNNCLLEGGYYYITSIALVNGLVRYLGKSVRLSEVSKALSDAGVLDSDLDTRTKKKRGRRHYAIHCALLERTYKAGIVSF